MNANKTKSLWTRREMLVRVGLGSVAGLALTACGGGGGGDDSSGDAQALRNAFAKLRDGMKTSDVEALVGFLPNDQRTSHELTWIVDQVRLYVSFRTTGEMAISSASLKEGNSPAQSRQFQ